VSLTQSGGSSLSTGSVPRAGTRVRSRRRPRWGRRRPRPA
jgi:hypothetical protein